MDVTRATHEQESQNTPETELQEDSGWTVMMSRLAPEMQLSLDRVTASLNREARERYEATCD